MRKFKKFHYFQPILLTLPCTHQSPVTVIWVMEGSNHRLLASLHNARQFSPECIHAPVYKQRAIYRHPSQCARLWDTWANCQWDGAKGLGHNTSYFCLSNRRFYCCTCSRFSFVGGKVSPAKVFVHSTYPHAYDLQSLHLIRFQNTKEHLTCNHACLAIFSQAASATFVQ